MFDKAFVLSKNNLCVKTIASAYEAPLALAASHQALWAHSPVDYSDPTVFKCQWFDKAMNCLRNEKRWPFVVIYKGQAIGSTSFYEISARHKRLTMGYTWYHPDYWGTFVNPLTKYLLLQSVFEALQFNRVSFSVDSINLRSCRALEKLGLQKEGVLKQHIIRADGTLRDSVIYAVIAKEWPVLKAHLAQKICHESD